jgi:transposase
MRSFHLTLAASQQRRLRTQLDQTEDARVYRRTLAILEAARGIPLAQIARTLGVSRRIVYYWLQAFVQRYDPADLCREDRAGRPTLWTEEARALLQQLLADAPAAWGYAAAAWTVPLLQEQLRHATGQSFSDDTIRRELHRLGYVWKRPRYRLQPDPELDQKTANLPANPATATTQRGACRGRNRPVAVSAVAGELVLARRASGRMVVGPQCTAGGFRDHESVDGASALSRSSAAARR